MTNSETPPLLPIAATGRHPALARYERELHRLRQQTDLLEVESADPILVNVRVVPGL